MPRTLQHATRMRLLVHRETHHSAVSSVHTFGCRVLKALERLGFRVEGALTVSGAPHLNCRQACCLEQEGWSEGMSTTRRSRPTR